MQGKRVNVTDRNPFHFQSLAVSFRNRRLKTLPNLVSDNGGVGPSVMVQEGTFKPRDDARVSSLGVF